MPHTFIVGDKNSLIQRIDAQIVNGEGLLLDFENQRDIDACEYKYKMWLISAARILEQGFSDNSLSSSFYLHSVSVKPESANINMQELSAHLKNAIYYLNNLKAEISSGLYEQPEEHAKTAESIDKDTAIEIVRRTLSNFHKHIEAMYQSSIHGSGTIRQEDLDKIRIGNEYDVQRILYSLLKPVFPLARTEVSKDAGYKSVRYDIFIDEYDMAIEIKCSRKNMKERDLTEELGSDAFHYKAEHLFIFVFDKEKIIANPDSFMKTYKRDRATFGRDIEAIVIQPISL